MSETLRFVLAFSLLSAPFACKRTTNESTPPPPAASASTMSVPSAKARKKVAVALPPISPVSDKAVTFAGKETKVVVCKLDASAPVMSDKEWWFHALASMAVAKDGSLYVVDQENKLRHYVNQSTDGCELALDAEFGKAGIMDFQSSRGSILNSVATDAKGAVYFSWHKDPKKIVDGVAKDFCSGFVRADASSSLVVADNNLLTGDGCSGKYVPPMLTGFDPSVPQYDQPKLVGLFGDELVSHGVDLENGKSVHKVGVHSTDGKRRLVLGGHADDAMSSIQQATKCGDDLCVLDAPLSATRLLRWTKDGKFLDKLSLSDVDLSMHGQNLGWSKAGLWVAGAVREKNEYVGVIALLPGV